jgi:tRNA threonylcarbamoyladenosine biosynthesis protein TsaB
MKLHLALDTATALGSVALGRGDRVLAEVLVGERRHAAATLPAIEEVLRLGGVGLADLAGLVVADGPGSFTGLRIGFATAKGLLREHPGLALGTAPSLMAAAWRAAGFTQGAVAALYDALRGEVFAALYRFGERGVEVVMAPRLTTPAELARTAPPPALAVGDGADAHAALMRAWTGREPVGPPEGLPRASALLGLLDVPGAVRPVEDPVSWEPDYGRLTEAQVRWERAHGRALPHTSSGTG